MLTLSIGCTLDVGRLTKLKKTMTIQGIKILTPSLFPSRNAENTTKIQLANILNI